jgi:hypothetical protein
MSGPVAEVTGLTHADAPSEEIRELVEDAVIREIGPIARPRRIMIVPDMAKDAFREDYAPGAGSNLEQRGCWRHFDAGQSRNRRGDPADEELIRPCLSNPTNVRRVLAYNFAVFGEGRPY